MIDRATVEHVARLARLGLTEDEKVLFGAQLSRILTFVEHIADDTVGALPRSDVGGPRVRLRPDEVTASLDRTAALANTPTVEAGFVRVPAVLD